MTEDGPVAIHTGQQDFSERAVAVVDFIVDTYDETETETETETEDVPESSHALAVRKGGHARREILTPAELSASPSP